MPPTRGCGDRSRFDRITRERATITLTNTTCDPRTFGNMRTLVSDDILNSTPEVHHCMASVPIISTQRATVPDGIAASN